MIKNYWSLFLLFTVFQLGAQKNIFEASKTGDLKAMEQMIELNSDTVNALNDHGHSPLILATYNNQPESAQILIDNGADVNFTFSQGSAIHGAAFKGYTEMIKLLVNNGAAYDEPDQNGTTPLIYATLFKHNEAATLLFKQGADINHKDGTGSSALEYAKSLKNSELLTLFKTPSK